MNKKYLNFITTYFRKQKGLTLIEILIAVAMLSMTIIAVSGLFVAGINYHRRVLATQELIDQTSYIMEYMSRALRMAKRDANGGCIQAGRNYELTSDGIKFLSSNGDCTEFYLDGGQIKKKIGALSWNLLSSTFTVKFLNFSISGEDSPPTDTYQPRVTIILDVSGRAIGNTGSPRVQVQTTVSQRNLDI